MVDTSEPAVYIITMKDYLRAIEKHKTDKLDSDTLVRHTWMCAWLAALGLILALIIR